MTVAQKQLLFSDVDGLAFAAARGILDEPQLQATYVPDRLGPLLELLHLSGGHHISDPAKWFAPNKATPMITALKNGKEAWIEPSDRSAGFIRAVGHDSDNELRLTSFLMRAKSAGQNVSGLPAEVSGQLVAAMRELENNIHEHAEASETGIIAFMAEPTEFEFVVADRGVGILRSLRRCADFATLKDEGKALESALTDGVSRYGPNSGHGHGFRPIFTGLVELRGELRFRSGDHSVTMDGTSPTLATSRIAQKAPIDGFFASVRCCGWPK